MPVRMVTITKSIDHKCWRGCGRKEIFLEFWWEYKLLHTHLHTGEWYGGSLKKLKIDLLCDPEIPLLGIYLQKVII